MNKKFLPIKSTFFDELAKRDHFFKDSLFDDLFNFKSALPALNISEDDSNYQIELAYPGAKKENFTVQVKDNNLVIKYENKAESNVEEKNYHKKEFSSESFIRTLEIPGNTDLENIKSKYENGVLNIHIPKLEKNEENIKTVNIE
jgi:HSP20 family protein